MKISLEQIAINYVKTVQNRQSSEELISFYHSDIEQIEFPNAVTKSKTIRHLQDLKDSSEKGKNILLKEEYKIQRSYQLDNTVILEINWVGTLAIPLGNLGAGAELKAYFAQFYEFQDGKIIKLRNYDCFEPFN